MDIVPIDQWGHGAIYPIGETREQRGAVEISGTLMPTVILLVVGVYILAVGIMGNGHALLLLLEKDLPHFIPWIIAIIVLGVLALNKDTEKLGKPFLLLVFLGILVHDWPQIKNNAVESYKEMTE